MIDVVALGEALIDFTPNGTSGAGMRVCEQKPGGAPANVLTALTKLGLKTAFIGKVGNDMHGEFLKETMEAQHIDTSGLIIDDSVFTTLAFVSLNEKGERNFSFARKPGADTCLRPEEVKKEIVQDTKVFHFGSLSLTNDPSRSATWEAIKLAKESGAIISYDPNYLEPLWSSKEAVKEQMQSVLELVALFNISDEETDLLTEEKEPEAAAKLLVQGGIPLVVVTLGSEENLFVLKRVV